MKYVRSFCGTVALTLVISLSTFAGELDCPVVQPLPPPTTTTTGANSNSMTEIVVSLIEGVLSLS
jgi:hypothetical protein